ncbi:MAG: hypothetical protein M1830_004983 [Pleopsidium flavum]|nr:MAG: hypothetical protein M1830_004983 [Pleopsidium flavum]
MAQQSAATYLDLLQVSSRIAALRNVSLESQVAAIWSGILNYSFPLDQGFLVRAEQSAGQGQLDLLVEQTIFVEADGHVRNFNLFVVELKRPALEASDTAWRDAKIQLEDYLRSLHTPHNRAGRLFAAVGVGRYVWFYEWDMQQGRAVEMHAQHLHLKNDAQAVQNMLVFVRDNFR